VNTGRYVGKRTGRLEDTIVKTNLEAVKEIVRQIRDDIRARVEDLIARDRLAEW